MNLRINKFNGKYRFKLFKTLILIFAGTCLSACQFNGHNSEMQYPNSIIAANTVNYGQYYLALKNLSENELQQEIKQQELKKSQGSIEARINLILLNSLPNSPIHNVYTAKSQLNEQGELNENYYLSPADQAFISVLKDQLNQQLFLFQKLINQELADDKKMAAQRIQEKKQLNKIANLELTVKQLTKQITQLKKIEQTISGHGQ